MITTLLNSQLKIKTKLINPMHRSTIYKYKEYKKQIFVETERITLLDFIWSVEQTVDSQISEYLTEEENKLLKNRIIYQCIRFNVIDSIYKYMHNIQKIKKKTSFYSFIEGDDLKFFTTNDVLHKNIKSYKSCRFLLDSSYVSLNNQFRKFYLDFFLNEINKARVKEANEMNEKLGENTVIQKNDLIQHIYKKYKIFLPEFPLKNDQKSNLNHFFDSIIKNDSSWVVFLQKYQEIYPLLSKNSNSPKNINLMSQTSHYKEQIAIYLYYILCLIEKHPHLPLKDLCIKPVLYDVYFNQDLNEDQLKDILKENTFFVRIKENQYTPVEINMNNDKITLQDINRYISFLTDVENYFYCLLEAMFMLVLYSNSNLEKTK